MFKSLVIITTSKKIKNLCLDIRKTCPSNMPWTAKKIYINTFFHPIKKQPNRKPYNFFFQPWKTYSKLTFKPD